MDVFLKLDNLGADLLTRTLSPLVGKTADYNFVESAKFLAQISQVCEHNPTGAQILASKMTKVQPQIRDEFARIALRIGSESADASEPPQMANSGPDGSKFTANVTRRTIAPQANFDKTNDPIALDPSKVDPRTLNAAKELSNQLNPQRVPAMTLSDSSVVAEATPSSAAQFQARPTPIAPAKPNIYMRR